MPASTSVMSRVFQPVGDRRVVAANPIEQSGKLRPVGIQSDAEQTDSEHGGRKFLG